MDNNKIITDGLRTLLLAGVGAAALTVDKSQEILKDLVDRGEYFGKMSKRYKYAEGWIRHNPLGFCDPDDNPLMEVLGPSGDAFINEEFEKTTRVENYM